MSKHSRRAFEPGHLDGIHVAIVTPFDNEGQVDHAALGNLADALIRRGIHGLVPCGSTGEAATLTHAEHIRVIRTVVEAADGRVPVTAGTGSNATDEAIQLTREAAEAGADAALLISPYYNKPSQEGLYRHIAAIAAATDLPLVLYNIPGRTAVSMLPETVGRLAELPTVVGLKDATGSVEYTMECMLRVPPRFRMLAGDDAWLLPMLALGGHGTISVVAHLLPEECVGLWNDWQAGRAAEARARALRMQPLTRALFAETNPCPVKAALALTGQIPTATLRLPLTRVTHETLAGLRSELARLGLPHEGTLT